jgi:hypothetical protein
MYGLNWVLQAGKADNRFGERIEQIRGSMVQVLQPQQASIRLW